MGLREVAFGCMGLQAAATRDGALRFVKAGGWLWLPENVDDAVVANSVAAAKIGVRVVIESAPTDAARVLRVGGQLIVNTRMAHGVLGQALDLVNRFGGIGVPDKFGVEVARMMGRLQGKTKIVHGENVFEEFRLLEVADATSGPGGVEAMSQSVGADVKIVIVARFINTHATEDDAGVIPVAADHAANVINGN